MFKVAPALQALAIGLALLAPTVAAAQEVVCRPLADTEVRKLIIEPGEVLVKDSGVECRAGETLIQTRYQIMDYTSRYDCEIRVKGEKPYCWRLS
jgi:hypothetical protein